MAARRSTAYQYVRVRQHVWPTYASLQDDWVAVSAALDSQTAVGHWLAVAGPRENAINVHWSYDTSRWPDGTRCRVRSHLRQWATGLWAIAEVYEVDMLCT